MSPRISLRLLSGQSDERLLALARGGHERAFEALVQRYRRPLLRFCRHTMRLSHTRAEDVVQQSLLKAWMALAAGTEVRDFKPWLYSIVRNTAFNALRGQADAGVALSDATRARLSIDSELEHRLEMRDALTHVAALPRAQREAIFLTVIDGRSHEEVASTLGVTHDAVRGLLYRARTTLRKAAAVITPQPLIAWAAGGAGTAAPSAERIAEVTSGAGALGAGGLLAKGAALALTAGALATGAVQLGHSARHNMRAASASASASPVRASNARSGYGSSPATTAAGPNLLAPTGSGGGGGATAPAAIAPSHGAPADGAPSHAKRSQPRASVPQDGSSETTGSSSDDARVPAATAPVAGAAGTTVEQQAPPQPQPPAPPPTEEPKTGPDGGGELDDGASCTTTEPSPERQRCDE